VTGFAVLAVGFAMVVSPGPANLPILIALGILAGQFFWARNILKKVRSTMQKTNEGGRQQ
jgi:hypothetical protein